MNDNGMAEGKPVAKNEPRTNISKREQNKLRRALKEKARMEEATPPPKIKVDAGRMLRRAEASYNQTIGEVAQGSPAGAILAGLMTRRVGVAERANTLPPSENLPEFSGPLLDDQDLARASKLTEMRSNVPIVTQPPSGPSPDLMRRRLAAGEVAIREAGQREEALAKAHIQTLVAALGSGAKA